MSWDALLLKMTKVELELLTAKTLDEALTTPGDDPEGYVLEVYLDYP